MPPPLSWGLFLPGLFPGREGEQLTQTISTQVFVPVSLGSKANTTCLCGHRGRPVTQQADSSAAFHPVLAVLSPREAAHCLPLRGNFRPGIYDPNFDFSLLFNANRSARPQYKTDTGIPHFPKVGVMSLHFYRRPTLVPVFANQKKSRGFSLL